MVRFETARLVLALEPEHIIYVDSSDGWAMFANRSREVFDSPNGACADFCLLSAALAQFFERVYFSCEFV
jgi:hypothetical protein